MNQTAVFLGIRRLAIVIFQKIVYDLVAIQGDFGKKRRTKEEYEKNNHVWNL